MKGFYVYGIASQIEKFPSPQPKGIAFGQEPEIYYYKDLAAVASRVDMQEIDREKLLEKLNNDVKWAKKNIVGHHQVVDYFSQQTTMIPLRFGTIFQSEKELEQELEKNYRRIKRIIQHLEDKIELGIKVYFDFQKVKKKEIKKFVKSGREWYQQKKRAAQEKKKAEEVVLKKLGILLKTLKKNSQGVAFNEILSKERNQEKGMLVLNAACLIERSKTGIIYEIAQQQNEKFSQSGLLIEVSGPWPPYSFTDKEQGKVNKEREIAF